MNNIQITPKIWGPMCWNLLHGISINYTVKHKKKYYYLIKKLEYILPCPKCILHYKMFIEKNPIDMKKMSKKYLIDWFINFHNSVNKLLKKEEITNEKAIKLIKHPNYINNKSIFTFFIIINYYYLTKKLSLFYLQKIKTFYKLMGSLYPDKDIKKNFNNLIKKNTFKNISNETELNNWFKTYVHFDK